MARKRYAIVGCGSRHHMYAKAMVGEYRDYAELVALCDKNQGRLRLSARRHLGAEDRIPLYGESDFRRMIAETMPDAVIVTSQDSTHHLYIIGAMEAGCNVVTEKPMTIDAGKCSAIFDAMARTGRALKVTFNYRYSPPRSQVKDLLMSGVIGRILSVDFHWLLDTRHGADYFRRWHRNKENSGGLMVHKATHHFDLINWWIASVPETVCASGGRNYYTPQTADRLGLQGRGERCVDCPAKERCPFFLDITSQGLKELYRDCESYDGYFRDRCVFSPSIDIEDTMNLVVRYRNGVFMAYSLNAFCPKEGFTVAFNGSRGRLEHTTLETSYVSGAAGGKVHETLREGTGTWVFPHFADPYPVELWSAEGGHGGGDDPLLMDVFHPHPPPDKYRRAAGAADGAWSILTGVAANLSMASGKPVRVPDLVKDIPLPHHTDMPEW